MSSRLLAAAGCTLTIALAASSVWAQSQQPTGSAAGAKAATTQTKPSARQAVTAATGTTAVKPAAAQQSKSPEAAAKAADSWKAGCSHMKDSDA